jgi:hypothetical protein
MTWRNKELGVTTPNYDGSVWGVPFKAGNRVTITIEEAVSECCEKWRGVKVWRGTTASFVSLGPVSPIYCPECGKKL